MHYLVLRPLFTVSLLTCWLSYDLQGVARAAHGGGGAPSPRLACADEVLVITHVLSPPYASPDVFRNDLELLLVLLPQRLGLKAQEKHGGRICAGMLGFPNVGKSSVINTLMSASRATHGKGMLWHIAVIVSLPFPGCCDSQALYEWVSPPPPAKQSTSRR